MLAGFDKSLLLLSLGIENFDEGDLDWAIAQCSEEEVRHLDHVKGCEHYERVKKKVTELAYRYMEVKSQNESIRKIEKAKAAGRELCCQAALVANLTLAKEIAKSSRREFVEACEKWGITCPLDEGFQ